jgi:AcrR family transcriptional regulator
VVTSRATAAPRERAAHLGPERRRPQVLDAALTIAVQSGVAAVTIGAVAEQLAVTRPAVYACFADRVELLNALLARESELLLNGLLRALHTGRGDDPEAAFITGYQAMLRVVADRPDTWRLLFAANPDPVLSNKFTAARQALTASATRWIGPAMTAWWRTPDLDRKLPVLIELFISSCESAARSLLDSESSWNAEDLGEFYGRAMCSAFQAA